MIGECLARHLACIGTLSASDRAALCTLTGETRDLRRNEDILRSGMRPTAAVVVLSGFLQRYTMGPDGARQIHSFYLPTDAPCLETLHIDYLDNNLCATVDSRVGLIPHVQIYRLMAERPEVLKLIWRETLIQAAVFREWLMRNSNMPADASMAHFFCEMLTRAKAAGISDGTSCELPITQQDLSEALGMTPVHANRTLMVLRSSGVVEWRAGKLSTGNWRKLADLADFDPDYLHLRGC